jgi:hypothetical protein
MSNGILRDKQGSQSGPKRFSQAEDAFGFLKYFLGGDALNLAATYSRLSGIRSQAIAFETRLSNGSIPESRRGHTKGLEPGDMGEMPTLPS